MSKKLNFERPNKEQYKQNFEKITSLKNWPPQEGVLVYIQNQLYDLIELEVKEVLAPQLKDLQTTIYTPGIMNIMYHVTKKEISYDSANKTYEVFSNDVFFQLEAAAPFLLGEEDPCGWF
jgi:tyrosine-protein phosphatase YwqE